MYLILFVLFELISVNPFHDIQVAFFKIEHDSYGLSLDIKTELNHFTKAADLEDASVTEALIKYYVSKNLSILINGDPAEISVGSYKVEDRHLHIHAKINYQERDINRITLTNTFLLSLDDHSNIIEFRLKDQLRDFLMNEKRKQITVEF